MVPVVIGDKVEFARSEYLDEGDTGFTGDPGDAVSDWAITPAVTALSWHFLSDNFFKCHFRPG
jgi:hypothetical protein